MGRDEKEMKEEIQFLKELQATLKHEDEHDNDGQASPRFWAIMDYRVVPTHEDFDVDRTMYYHNDGDHIEFETIEDLKEFLSDHYLEDDEQGGLAKLLNNEHTTFDVLWDFVQTWLNDDGYFNEIPVKEESFIVPDTMFLTKEEAKRHLELNHYHYTSKAHTFAMTAWRAPKVEKLLNILMYFDWDNIQLQGSEKTS